MLLQINKRKNREYLSNPPTQAALAEMIAAAGLTVREAIQAKGTPYLELGLDSSSITDQQLLQKNGGTSHPHQPPIRHHTIGNQAVSAIGTGTGNFAAAATWGV